MDADNHCSRFDCFFNLMLEQISFAMLKFLFMLGLFCLCIMMVDILLHAHLMAGWFQRQRKGESDEDFKKRKIDVHKVASEKKNEPIHFKTLV